MLQIPLLNHLSCGNSCKNFVNFNLLSFFHVSNYDVIVLVLPTWQLQTQ